MSPVISISNLSKVYPNGLKALDAVSLDVAEGEILALLGPNGAGKTTMISIICGLVTPSSGTVRVGGHDIISDFRAARRLIGLVPQELHVESFETVRATVTYSRGLFGKPRNDALVDQVLKDLSLWDKRNDKIIALSGGMKRRVMIAKALAHEPRVLFLDEPTAGVDVELRKSMWELIERLRETGVTVILTTHYIEEAENIADRVGVIDKGKILLVEQKDELMRKLGEKVLSLFLREPIETLPSGLEGFDLTLADDGATVVYRYDTAADRTGIGRLLSVLSGAGIRIRDLTTHQSSLEDIFVNLVRNGR